MTRTYIDPVAPILLADLKSHILMTGDDFDAQLAADLHAAIAATENHTGLCIWRSVYFVTCDYAREIRLPVRNVTSVTSIYPDGAQLPLPAESWSLRDDTIRLIDSNGHTAFRECAITFEAGYSHDTLPHDMKVAILMQAANIFSYPDDPGRQMTTASEKLLAPYRNINI